MNDGFYSWDRYKQDGDVATVAQLVYQAHPEFYDLFSEDHSHLLEAIRQQLEEPESELGLSKVLVRNGSAAGAISWYHTRETDDRKLTSLHMMIGVFGPSETCFAGLRRFKQEVPLIEAEGCYLARIAVAESSRGTGLGQILLNEFEQESVRLGCRDAWLHVWRTNARAIHFYQAAGYRPVPPLELGYLAMSRTVEHHSQHAA